MTCCYKYFNRKQMFPTIMVSTLWLNMSKLFKLCKYSVRLLCSKLYQVFLSVVQFFFLEFHFKSTNHTRTYNIDVDHTSRRLATLQIKSNRHSSRYVVLRYWSPKYFKTVFLSHSPKLDTLYLESHVHSNFRFLADILPTLYSLFSKHDRYPPD